LRADQPFRRLRKMKYAVLGIFLLLSISFYGQQAKVTGKVTGEQDNPLPGVNVFVRGTPTGVITDLDGLYTLIVPAQERVIIMYSLLGYEKDSIALVLELNENRKVVKRLSQRTYDRSAFEIVDQQERESMIQRLDPKIAQTIVGPGGGVEMILKTLPGVYSNNEMSSQYSVRGGNFDENLVYVNDVEIYRPFLVRAGQQEGLSFANPDMIQDLKFSAGGFDAQYGDKLSSVLDITYKRPKKFAGAAGASLLGGTLQLEGASKGYRLAYMIGARQRTTQYLLNSLDVTGQYRPSFTDVQTYISYNLTTNWDIDFLGNYAVNNYRIFPVDQRTEFGTINQALRLRVFFEGKEQNRFATSMGAVTSTWRPHSKLKLKLIASAFDSDESERSDVLGQYFIDELERDLSSASFGDVAFNRGIGSYLTYVRNRLQYQVQNIEHKGFYETGDHYFKWGIRAQSERIEDQLNEWRMVDSADFSLPQMPGDSILLDQVIKARSSLFSMRYQTYVQDNFRWRRDSVEFVVTAGVRANYWTLNEQLLISPRVAFSVRPLNWERDIVFRAAVGHYAQPPFYRELRSLEGVLNPDLKAQESWHFILGTDFNFTAWNRPFNFYAETYYKALSNLVPYEVDNVRIRYYADNISDGFAYGLDMKVNGEFVKGVQSWASLSLMRTMEDIRNDFYYEYYNSDGERIVPGFTANKEVADSIRREPGFIPRPTDQRLNFSLFFQDYLPRNPTLGMQITIIFGTGLPMGPPDFNRFRDTLRIPPYRRVDLGFSKHFISPDTKVSATSPFRHLNSLSLSLEVFNLLGVNNTVSYLWLKDVTNRLYGIPNYLTNRLLNLRLQATF